MKNGLEIDDCGNKIWWKNNFVHRKDGPAVEYKNGTKFWCINGKWHREDGPAGEWHCGCKQWYLNGENLGSEKPNNWDELVLKFRAKKLCDL
jgi:hypothetical protein